MKAAKTEWFVFIPTTHWPKPLQSPAQPLKVEPPSGVAVSVTVAPVFKFAEQVAPQLIPAGLLVTVPVPPPTLVTVSAICTGGGGGGGGGGEIPLSS